MKHFYVIVALLLLIPAMLFARVSGDPIQKFEKPFLLTSGGQGPGSKMLRFLLIKENVFAFGEEFDLEDEPEPRMDYLLDHETKTLVIVLGVTEKGLGASGEDIEHELDNLKDLLVLAKREKVKIIAMSIEIDKRQKGSFGAENERVIDLVCPEADWIICLKKNNKDKRFTKFSKQYGIPLTTVESALELTGIFPEIFRD